MNIYPYLDINIDKIEQNARILTTICNKRSIDVAGVTKVVCGHPKVARAMLRGGVKQIADSRIDNIQRMRDDGIRAEMILLRLPMLSNIAKVVQFADISLNSELKIIKALSDEALKIGKIHRVILMIDLGDLREGILPQDTLETAKNILEFKGVELYGIGTNLACLSGVQPDRRNMELLVYIAEELRKRLSIPLPVVSGGNTFSLPLLVQDELPEGINHFRLGAGLILNASPTPKALNLNADTIRLHAEILELKQKPSTPYGMTAENAFGQRPTFDDKGTMLRAVLGIGREDINPAYLFPVGPKVEILGASSDHLVADVTRLDRELTIGDALEFNLEYGAVLAAMTSKYVYKNIIYHPGETIERKAVRVLSVPNIMGHDNKPSRNAPLELIKNGLFEKIKQTGFKVQDGGELNNSHHPEKLSAFVAQQIKQNRIPVVLGGPHSIILPELIGIQNAVNEFGLICFDAHGDIITYLLSDQNDQLSFSFENYVVIGVRDLTRNEREKLENSSITVYTMEHIDRLGMVQVMKHALNMALKAVDGVHVSLDMDFVDMKDAPGVVTPEPGGINYREAHLAMELIAETGRLLSIDIAELAPSNDTSSVTVKLGISLITTLLGKRLIKKKPDDQQ